MQQLHFLGCFGDRGEGEAGLSHCAMNCTNNIHAHSVLAVYACVLSHFSCDPTLCDPVDRSPRLLSVHGILQARILE